MQIREVRVRNVRSFAEGRLPLGPGTTLLWGDVGAGKTSLLNAIEMALFGFAEVDPAHLVRHRAPTADVALTLVGDGQEYVFARRFHRRLRKGRDVFEPDEKGTGLTTNGSTVRYSTTELRQRAIELLGFPDNPNPRAHSDLWRWAVYIPQERMRQILEAGDAEARLDTVRKALGLEKYRIAAENAQLLARRLKEEHRVRDEEAARRSGSEAELVESEATAEGLAASARSAEREEGDRRRALDELGDRKRRHEEIARSLEGDRREERELAARRVEWAGRLAVRSQERAAAEDRRDRLRAEIDRMHRLGSEAADLDERTKERESELAVAQVELARLETEERAGALAELRRESARARARDAREAIERARSEAERSRRVYEEAAARRGALPPASRAIRELADIDRDLAGAIARAEGRAGDLNGAARLAAETEELVGRGVCPRCGQPVTASAFHGHLTEVRSALAQAREEYERAVAARARFTDERAERERSDREGLVASEAERREAEARSDRDRAEAAREAAAEHLRGREQELAEALSDGPQSAAAPGRLSEVRGTAQRLGEELRLIAERRLAAERAASEVRLLGANLDQTGRDLQRLAEEIAESETRHRAIDERLRELARSIAAAGAFEGEAAALSEALLEAQGALERAVAVRHRTEAEAEAARARVGEVRGRVAEYHHLRTEALRLERTAGFLAGPFRDGMLELEYRLLARAKSLFDTRFARYFALLVEDPALVARTDARFAPLVEMGGETTPPEALSGGERTALALAYRLALGDVVRTQERLDLATLILDEPTDGFSPEQVERMGELLSGLGLPQVLLVSHEAALSAIADRTVRIEKVDGASVIREEGPRAYAPPAAVTGASGTEPRPTAAARRPSGSRRDAPGPSGR